MNICEERQILVKKIEASRDEPPFFTSQPKSGYLQNIHTCQPIKTTIDIRFTTKTHPDAKPIRSQNKRNTASWRKCETYRNHEARLSDLALTWQHHMRENIFIYIDIKF